MPAPVNLRRALQSKLLKPGDLARNRWLGWLGHRLHDPNLWHFGRRSVSRAAGVGLFVAFFPIPIHMLLVVPIALVLGVNLPVMVAAVWITNPVTWVPIFYFAYRLGSLVIGHSAMTLQTLNLGADWHSFSRALAEIWLPMCVGAAICGVVCGCLGYAIVESVWRLSVIRRWRAREVRLHSPRGDTG
ncbi:MAG: DUF2062 domain-containing protein [Gammaproteobacteria bacterium]